MTLSYLRKFCLLLALVSLLSPAQAEWLPTQKIISDSRQPLQQIEQALLRADVQQALAERGVNASLIQKHLASMTDEEIAILNQHLKDAPAGGDGGTVTIVLVILAILEILGITDLFTFM